MSTGSYVYPQTNAWISANLTALRSLSSDSVAERVS